MSDFWQRQKSISVAGWQRLGYLSLVSIPTFLLAMLIIACGSGSEFIRTYSSSFAAAFGFGLFYMRNAFTEMMQGDSINTRNLLQKIGVVIYDMLIAVCAMFSLIFPIAVDIEAWLWWPTIWLFVFLALPLLLGVVITEVRSRYFKHKA